MHTEISSWIQLSTLLSLVKVRFVKTFYQRFRLKIMNNKNTYGQEYFDCYKTIINISDL